MSDDNEARARELAEQVWIIGNRVHTYDTKKTEISAVLAAALAAAVTRGRIAGLEEAREIASGSFGWSMSVWRDMTKKDMTRLMAEAIVEAIDARLVTIAPPAETTEPT